MTEIQDAIIHQQRIAARELGTMTREREQRPPSDLDLATRLERVRQATAEVRLVLAKVAPTQASEVETWLITTEQQVTELGLLTEAVAKFQAEAEVEGYGTIRFIEALDAIERHLEASPERAAQAWDGAQQLAPALEDPRLASVPEVARMMARYRDIAARVAIELEPRLASARARPLVQAAQEIVDALGRETDYADEDGVIRRRAELRDALARIPRHTDVPEIRELDERAAAMLARSEAELGGHIVLAEIERAERVIEPLLEQVERGLALASTERVIEHAPRLRTCLPALAPFIHHERARRLEERARAALQRIASELGAACAQAVEEADAVPVFAVDRTAGTRIEAVVRRINTVLAEYRDAHLSTQARFEAEVDLVDGTPQAATDRVVSDIERTARELVRTARQAEEIAGELSALAPDHPAIAAIAQVTPVLIRRAQTWKLRLATLIQYANAIEEVRHPYERARELCDRGAPDGPNQALYVWPEVLTHLKSAEASLATAVELLPDEPERVARWRTRIASTRSNAVHELASTCVAEVTRNAKRGDMYEAQRFADALAEAVPDSTDNARIAAMLAGTADAREQAKLEIERHGALIRRCAEVAARTARPAFDSWVAERPPLVTLAGTIVANIDLYRGRFIAGRCSHLGLSLADEPDTIRGDVYQIDYDPEVRRQLAEGMARLDGMFASRAEQTAAAAGVDGLCTTTQHYPSDAHYHAEIVGLASYTPIHEVRDVHGTVLTTFTGVPYPVPRIVIRAVATTMFVVVPGEPPSLDAMTTDPEG